MMIRPVALKQRGQFAVLLASMIQEARKLPAWQEPDRRNLQLWRALLLAVLVRRSTRLLSLAHALGSSRRAQTVKTVAQGIAYFLRTAQCAVTELTPCLLEGALRHLDASHLSRYAGKVLVVLDPTEYPKRGRGTGKCGRHMQHLGRVRKANEKARATTAGYVDVWAGLVLRGKRFFPLARCLFSSAHPNIASQNQVEEAVLAAALACVARVGLEAIVVADRGFGRKALLIQLAQRAQAFVIRIDADITVQYVRTGWEGSLAALLAQQPWLGDVIWDRGEAGKLRCRARKVRGRIHFSRSGRKRDTTDAFMTFLELVPCEGNHASLVLATNFWVTQRGEAQGIAQVYAQRWAIESGFETMKAWGLDAFMVRQWEAIERLLWIVALAYALATIALYGAGRARFREGVVQVLRREGAVRRRLTAGKVAEAIGYDIQHHARAWLRTWLH